MISAGRREWVALAAAVLLLGALMFVLWRLTAGEGLGLTALDERDVERFVRSWGAWSAAASVGLMVLHSFLPLPAEIVTIANGMLFGPLLGIALTWLGAMLGAVLSFALARALGRGFVRLFVSPSAEARLMRYSPQPGTLLYLRLVPLISFNLINYAAGLLGVPWWRFLWTTALGILPLTVAMVLLGAEMLHAPLWLWLAVGAALLLLWLVIEAWRRRVRPNAP